MAMKEILLQTTFLFYTYVQHEPKQDINKYLSNLPFEMN